jgi:hypothetical protein
MANAVARSRAVAFVAAALALASCGLTHHDSTVTQDFTAGGGAPNAVTFNGSSITSAVSASAGDLSKLSSVTLQSAHLSATDTGDLSFVSGATLTLSATGFQDLQLATLPAAPSAGQTDVALTVSSADLRGYLAAGASLKAALTYSPQPVAARGLRLTLVVRGSL